MIFVVIKKFTATESYGNEKLSGYVLGDQHIYVHKWGGNTKKRKEMGKLRKVSFALQIFLVAICFLNLDILDYGQWLWVQKVHRLEER